MTGHYYVLYVQIWEFPKIRGTVLGVPILRTIVFGALYWVPLFWETTIHNIGTHLEFLHSKSARQG